MVFTLRLGLFPVHRSGVTGRGGRGRLAASALVAGPGDAGVVGQGQARVEMGADAGGGRWG